MLEYASAGCITMVVCAHGVRATWVRFPAPRQENVILGSSRKMIYEPQAIFFNSARIPSAVTRSLAYPAKPFHQLSLKVVQKTQYQALSSSLEIFSG